MNRRWRKLHFADIHSCTARNLLFWRSSLGVCNEKGIQHLREREITGESSAIVCKHLSGIGRLGDLVLDRTIILKLPLNNRYFVSEIRLIRIMMRPGRAVLAQ